MEKRILCFALLLLLLIGCFGNEVKIEKTNRGQTGDNQTVEKEIVWKSYWSKPIVTAVCSNETLNVITLLICKMRDCLLSYRIEQGFESNCHSRFQLISKKQTFFLLLTSLTPEDDGNYTCECSRPDGSYSVHLSVTMEGDFRTNAGSISEQMSHYPLLCPAVIVILTGMILGVVFRRMRNRKPPETLYSSRSNKEAGDIEPYSTFVQRESGLYSTVQLHG